MWIVSDVHGATAALRVASSQLRPLLVLGDLINFIDYRTNDGIVAEISGRDFTEEMVRLRTAGDLGAARALWREFSEGREKELRARYDEHIDRAYADVCSGLVGADAYVTYGNVDRPELLQSHLPSGVRFVDAEVVEIEGTRVGFAGGGLVSIGTPGEVTEDVMADKLDRLGKVDVLCTHVPPAIDALATDVIARTTKGSRAVLEYLAAAQPAFHYFGDIHQPRASHWRHGPTMCINAGYFRATGRAVRHG